MKDLQKFFTDQLGLIGMQCAHHCVETSVRTENGILRISYDPEARITVLAWEPKVMKDDYDRLAIATRQYAESLVPDIPWEVERKGIFVKAQIGWGLVKA